VITYRTPHPALCATFSPGEGLGYRIARLRPFPPGLYCIRKEIWIYMSNRERRNSPKEKKMKGLLAEERFNSISTEDKAFILAFDAEISKLGYGFGGRIGSGFCWGQYMIIYSKIGVRSKQVAARIYIRERGIVLRLFLNKIDRHRGYIENAPPFIKEAFTGEYGNCRHCHNDKGGICKFRKTYTLYNHDYEKCNGITFEFWEPDLAKLQDYISLLKEFYPNKKNDRSQQI
jgi:hypothetical protein